MLQPELQGVGKPTPSLKYFKLQTSNILHKISRNRKRRSKSKRGGVAIIQTPHTVPQAAAQRAAHKAPRQPPDGQKREAREQQRQIKAAAENEGRKGSEWREMMSVNKLSILKFGVVYRKQW
jgi:hypothetical protein